MTWLYHDLSGSYADKEQLDCREQGSYQDTEQVQSRVMVVLFLFCQNIICCNYIQKEISINLLIELFYEFVSYVSLGLT